MIPQDVISRQQVTQDMDAAAREFNAIISELSIKCANLGIIVAQANRRITELTTENAELKKQIPESPEIPDKIEKSK